jgi:translin
LPVLRYEGPVRNAFEEYVEARLFYTYLKIKEIDQIDDLNVEYAEYIGGICDFTGELVRKATLLVIDGKYEELQEYYDIMKQIMAELLECNLTSYLRTKFDQLKRNVRKMEQIMYDISLKNN